MLENNIRKYSEVGMIEINEKFSIEREQGSWILYDTKPSDNKKSKTGFTTSKSWFPKLHQVIGEICERTPEGAENLEEVYKRMQLLKSDLYRRVMRG